MPESISPVSTADTAADVRDLPGRDDGGYRELAEAIPLIAWRTDAAGRLLDANGRWSDYSGRAPARGSRLTDDPAFHPDDAPELAEQWAAAAGTALTVDTQVRLRREDGEYRWFQLRAVPSRDDDGRLTAWIGTCTDIHDSLHDARSRENQRLNAVIRAMGEAVVVCAADGTITLTNPAGERLFPDVEERTYADILEQLSDPDGTAPALGALGGPVEIQTRADPDRWIELATYPVHVDTGSPPSGGETIVVMRDVTERRRREAVRETFIGVLSHELRTPVTTIFGGAKLLARSTSTLDEETQRGIFRDIHDEAERLQRLVEDVVALNRFGDEHGEVGAEPVLLQRLIPRVVGSEEGRWPGVTFSVDVAPGLPTVTADPTYVEQVLRNLVSNAAKYGGAGSTVTIVAEHGESGADGDQQVVVRVLDDGPGFPADEADRLFELFYRSPRTAGSAGGAGIGLFVCARLIAAMGGRIWAVPREGGGAEFGFALAELDE